MTTPQTSAKLDDVNKLWTLCKKFVETQQITCAESVYQSDRVIENAYELIEEICNLVGYKETA